MARAPDSIAGKDPRIQELLCRLEALLPAESYEIVDHWDGDVCAIGVACRHDPGRLVYISVFGEEDGRYAFECEVPMGEHPPEYRAMNKGQGVTLDALLPAITSHLLPGARDS